MKVNLSGIYQDARSAVCWQGKPMKATITQPFHPAEPDLQKSFFSESDKD
jgi:hypothetical protein